MRTLLVLSAAAMAIAVAPVTAASPSPAQNAPATSQSRYNDNDSCKKEDSNSSESRSTSGNEHHNRCKITICHATGSASNPYVTISVSNNATFGGHGSHAGDIIPAPPGGCPGYNPDDIHLDAWRVGDGQVEFKLWGCPKNSKVGVKIDGATVAGSPFKVPKGDKLHKVVAIPSGKPGNVLQITCSKPYIVWEVKISDAPPKPKAVPNSFAGPRPLTLSNPASVAAASNLRSSGTPSIAGIGSTGTPIPARQVGFGLASAFGLVAFGGLRHRTRA